MIKFGGVMADFQTALLRSDKTIKAWKLKTKSPEINT